MKTIRTLGNSKGDYTSSTLVTRHTLIHSERSERNYLIHGFNISSTIEIDQQTAVIAIEQPI